MNYKISKMDKRVIAIYLPQFHPFPENDEWWGKGFTEWTNVSKARPRFPGHYQPHLPADLGFYDLRVPEVREQQAQMAKEAGIYGFCYYHYWFNGKLLMDRPLKEVLESGKPDFPFMICWANENWTRAWDGGEKHILMKQDYTDEDAREHIRWFLPYFKDSRYIRIDNKPVIAIYRTTKIPNLKQTIEIWREEALKEGLELYICRFESFKEIGQKYITGGLDAAIEFQPSDISSLSHKKRYYPRRLINHLYRKLLGKNLFPEIFNYKKYVLSQEGIQMPPYKRYPCVTPSWDNSARRKNKYFAFTKSTPEIFKKWLLNVICKFKPYSSDENLVFINAWNEWAEGNHLEPDRKWGKLYLDAVKQALEEAKY